MPRRACTAAVLAMLVACSSGTSGAPPTVGPSATASTPISAPSSDPPSGTPAALRAFGLPLARTGKAKAVVLAVRAEAADMTAGVDGGGSARITACSLISETTTGECRSFKGKGTVTFAARAIPFYGLSLYADVPARIDLTLSYRAANRTVNVRLPFLAKPAGASVCKDNGCNPFFEMQPFVAGTVSVAATWPGSSRARLSIEGGAVSAHSFSATGTPYKSAGSTSGTSPLRLSGEVTGGEWAVAFEGVAGPEEHDLTGVQLAIGWP